MIGHHVGSGRRTVIPNVWESHHAPVAEGTMKPGVVALRIPGGTPGWDKELQQQVTVPHLPYASGLAARIQALTGIARIVDAADDDELVADYLVAIPRRVNLVSHGHLVEVANTGDPDLDGTSLTVVQVVLGTHRFERDLFCSITN